MHGVTVDLSDAAARLDLERRLEQTPATAMTRGVFFNLIEHELSRHRLVLPSAVKPPRGWRSYSFYPVRSLLTVFATAGALLDQDPLEGVRRIFRGGAQYVSSTWYGKAFQRFLKPDPTAALYWIERSREHMANYGRWRIESRAPGRAVIHMFDEYLWIDSAQRGGCEGLLHACGVEGEVVAVLDDQFNGRLFVSWSIRN
jgi:uncharacterized protein (TIGR02265 family)